MKAADRRQRGRRWQAARWPRRGSRHGEPGLQASAEARRWSERRIVVTVVVITIVAVMAIAFIGGSYISGGGGYPPGYQLRRVVANADTALCVIS